MLKISKNLFTLLFTIIFAVSIVACGGGSEETSDETSEESTENTDESTADSDDSVEEGAEGATGDSPIAGEWKVNGTAPEGDAYEGTLTINAITEQVHTLEWDITRGVYPGTGLYYEENNRLFSAYGVDTERYGLVAYPIEGSVLADEAVWTSGNGLGTETLVEKPADGIVGTYQVKGTRPEGDDASSTYEGSLTIEKQDNIYKLTWDLGDGEPYNGIAFITEDGSELVGAWGIGGDYGVVVYNFEGTTKGVGNWATPYDEDLGEETITR